MSRQSLSLRYAPDRLEILDQQALPDSERWLPADTVADMVDHIRALRVRGAPLLGVAAAFCLARRAHAGDKAETLRFAAAGIRASRPTAVNLMGALDRMATVLDHDPESIEREAITIFDEDVALCDRLTEHGLPLIEDGEGILTHCNTGGLATAGIGTALGLIRRAHEAGRNIHVWVGETRPLLQGARLTCWELRRLDIPHTLITDSMAPIVMRAEKVQRVLVGADRIAANGDFANKVGTYGLSMQATLHGIDLHAVAPWTTVDLRCPDGDSIPIEERDPEEVRGFVGAGGGTRWAPEGTAVFNPAFDVTPGGTYTSLVLDTGVVSREELMLGKLKRYAPKGSSPQGSGRKKEKGPTSAS